jgi:hypothetical protein
MRSTTHRRRPAVIRSAALASICAIVLGACSGGASTSPTATPGSSPTPGGAVLVLDRTPDDTGCDTIGINYTSVTFHIDLTASPQIWAEADTGVLLTVKWDSTFQAGTGAEPTVVDGSGAVVLQDGDILDVPEGAYPELKGHFVCTGEHGLTIFDEGIG